MSVYRAIGPLVLGEKPNSKKISPLPETYTNVRPAYLKAKSEPPVLEIPPTVSDRRSTVIHKELSLTNNGK